MSYRAIPVQVVAGRAYIGSEQSDSQLIAMDSTHEPEDPITSPPWGEFGRVVTFGFVSLVSKFVFNVWNTTHINNQAELLKQVQHRPKGRGLITVSNHTRQVH